MPNDINTYPVQQFIETVKIADMTQKKSITLDIKTARVLAFTLGEIYSKLNEDYESFFKRVQNSNTEVIEVKMDGGGFK